MDPRDAELLAKLLPTFRLEAEEHLHRIDLLLTSLERESSPGAMEEAFREMHSLKGAARAVGAGELEALCQETEGVFAAVKKGDLPLEREVLDLLFLAADLAADLAREAGRELPAEMAALAAATGRRLREAAQGRRVAPPPPPGAATETAAEPPPRPGPDTLRIDVERIEQILVQAEEILTEKMGAQGQAAALQELLVGLGRLRRDLQLAASEARTLPRNRDPRLRRLFGLLADSLEMTGSLEESGRTLRRKGGEHARFLGLKIDHLLAAVRETLMLPVATLFEPLPRIVRDLARASGKGVELETAGGEIPLDRRILEELRDPLLHLLRNAIDHGLETPAERQAQGKPERGRIRLAASSPSPRRVIFTLADDGRGLDVGKLKEAAVREGTLTAEAAETLDDYQAAELSFTSGISTIENATAVSGRGLGLPIVREKVERLGGEVHIVSRAGEGTTFRLEIPASLAAFRGVLARLGASRFIFPAVDVERVLRISRDLLQVVENRDLLELEGKPLPVVRLAEPLRLPLPVPAGERVLTLVVTASRQGRVAFAVDEILAEQEFLVKSLGSPGVKIANFSGAAILGDGGIALILDPEELVRNSRGGATVAARGPLPEEAATGRRRVLVVEDSITSRTLLRNILEGAGYAVVTAVDGIDALERLGSAVFDVVVSDVEMPRMDGFDLTRRIRERYDRLPVILVTGLGTPEDRERGMEAGADAYIVKSRFDQSNLLEVVGRVT